MKLADLIKRVCPPQAWTEHNQLPWSDPDFSARMLANHLSQDHDWASRRQDIIEKQIDWICRQLGDKQSVLDLACGPGLYTHILTERGHCCTGVDFSPASIEYATKQAADANLNIKYVLSDIRQYRDQQQYDCIMLVFGEFNVFTQTDASSIFERCNRMLKKGGRLIIEVYNFESVRQTGLAAATWWSTQPGNGVLSANAHICLQENFWDEENATTTQRYYILDPLEKEIKEYQSSIKAYTMDEYERLFQEHGFAKPELLKQDLWPVGEPFIDEMISLTSIKK